MDNDLKCGHASRFQRRTARPLYRYASIYFIVEIPFSSNEWSCRVIGEQVLTGSGEYLWICFYSPDYLLFAIFMVIF